MTLFWHNHFATAYSKVSGALGADEGARYMAAKPTEDPNQVIGQIELFRKYALGNFRDLLIAVAKDAAMLVWLDGRTNVKGKPQENFARELMELFTMGVDTFAARVYRMESCPAAERLLHVQLRRRSARHHRQGIHVSDLLQQQQSHSGASTGRGNAGRS
jgi:uncharacterized protein (DUF1800 family)